MNPPNRRRIRRRDRSGGAALIITLAFLVLVAIMVVGMMESMRVERSASRTHYERMRATTFAQQGVDRALASLRQATSDRPQQADEDNDKFQNRTRNWSSQPGQLLIPDPEKVNSDKSVDRKRIAAAIPLSSGIPSPELLQEDNGLPEVLRPPDLNIPTLLDPHSHLITEEEVLKDEASGSQSGGPVNQKTIAMNVRWIYVRKDGTYVTKEGKPTDVPNLQDIEYKENPIVGRFAYWADDEGTKVNYNLAWSRHPSANNPNAEGHQTRVGLDALLDGAMASGSAPTPTLATQLHQFVTKDNFQNIGRFFNSPFEARQISLANGAPDPLLAEALRLNKFNLTHYNSDPDTTFYGLPRLMLTTKPINAVRRDSQGNIMRNKDGTPIFRPFLDILVRAPNDMAENADPGFLYNIDAGTTAVPGGKLHLVVKNLVDNYLKKKDWPMVSGAGSSLQDKYYGRYNTGLREQRLAQLALNIIEYVRSAESAKPVVEPIRGKYNASGTFITDWIVQGEVQGATDSFKGVIRGPLITEMGMWVSPTPEATGVNKGRYKSLGFVEVFLPADYGLDKVDLIGLPDPANLKADSGIAWKLYFKEMDGDMDDPEDNPPPGVPKKKIARYQTRTGAKLSAENRITWRLVPDPPTSPGPTFVWDALGKSNRSVAMGPGEYRTIAIEGYRYYSRDQRPTVSMRAAITMEHVNGRRIDVAPLSDKEAQHVISLTLDKVSTPELITTVETADPRVNGVKRDWQRNTAGGNTLFGSLEYRINSRWKDSVGAAPLGLRPGEPKQDLDKDGKVSIASLRMPYPKGHPKNASGLVRSSGELGLVHTGVEGNNTASAPDAQGLLGGVPWRTLRLQPNSESTDVVPDWAFMDLFTVPADVPAKAAWLFNPHTTATGGRVNMNAHPEPFTMNRIAPLAAVLMNAKKEPEKEGVAAKRVSFSEAKQIAANIYNRVLANPRNGLPAGKAYGATGAFAHYESPGEVVEIEGVANNGEESEELVREIANLISSRSNVFSVYTVGQALRQTADGKLLVTSEQRQHAMLERYIESDLKTGSNAIDYTKFRTVYFRNLIP